MRITKSIVTGAVFALIGGAALAEDPKIYPYASAHNYCPDGLQPVTMNGVICCGTPTVKQSYQSAMSHPAPKKKTYAKKRRHVHKARSTGVCAEGEKGCY